MSDPKTPTLTRIWLPPFSILLGIALAAFVFSFMLDTAGDLSFVHLLFRPNPAAAQATLSSAAEVVAGILAIAITVVAIVVELAANRYTHRITELFVAEPVNFIVTGFFVVTALQAIFVGLMFDIDGPNATGFVPYWGVMMAVWMLGICLLILLPYFAFVFHFLSPIQIVERIKRSALKVVAGGGFSRGLAFRQAEAVRGIEQLADIGQNAMEHKDKGISMASVDALQAMVLEYQRVRPELEDAWFVVEGDLAHNPDFVSMSEEVLEAVSSRRIWFEMKVLRKYQTLFNEALNRMRDINYLVAINTRHIAEAALKHKNVELFDLSIKFFNTYLRSTINARDIRTAYNILHQYRLLAGAALTKDEGDAAIEVARYFKYYGLVSFNMKLPFILETCAYDLCELNEQAFDEKSPAMEELLRIFLDVDKESDTDTGAALDASLRGVRKAQVKLATYYLLHGDERLARKIYEDMASEEHERLASIRDELLGVDSSEFWEISDRGVNFDYLTPDRKIQMMVFFGWFEGLRGPRATIPMEPPSSAQPSEKASGDGGADGLGRGVDPGKSDVEPSS